MSLMLDIKDMILVFIYKLLNYLGIIKRKSNVIYLDDNNDEIYYLSNKLKSIKIWMPGYENSKLENLPDNIENVLIIGNCFNTEIDNLSNIKKLEIIGDKFNKVLNNLPVGLRELKIMGNNFNQELNNLPEYLERLEITCCINYNKKLDNLPLSLKKLEIGKEYLEYYPLEEVLGMIPLGCELYVEREKIDL